MLKKVSITGGSAISVQREPGFATGGHDLYQFEPPGEDKFILNVVPKGPGGTSRVRLRFTLSDTTTTTYESIYEYESANQIPLSLFRSLGE